VFPDPPTLVKDFSLVQMPGCHAIAFDPNVSRTELEKALNTATEPATFAAFFLDSYKDNHPLDEGFGSSSYSTGAPRTGIRLIKLDLSRVRKPEHLAVDGGLSARLQR
jgi:hypothetical protein